MLIHIKHLQIGQKLIQEKWSLPLIFVISSTFLLRLYIAFYGSPHWYSTDSFDYVKEAELILVGEWSGGVPLGYPLIISLFSLIFGQYRDPALILFNCIIWSACAFIVYYFVYQRTSSKLWALLAAFIVSIWPTHYVWTRSILTEAPTAFFLASGMMFIWLRRYFLGCLLLGVCVVIRPTFLPLLPLISIIIGCRDGWRKSVIVLILTALPYISMSAYAKIKTPEQHSTHFAEAVLLSNVHRSERGNFNYQGQSTKESIEIYINKIIDDPVGYISLRAHFLNMLWGPWPERHTDTGRATATIFVNALTGLQFPLVLLSLCGVYYRKDLFSLFFIGPAAVITAVHVVLFSTSRYNIPVVPLLTILAADGAFIIYSRHVQGFLSAGVRRFGSRSCGD